MRIILVLIIMYLVPVILGRIRSSAFQEQSNDTHNFTMTMPKEMAYFGYICGAVGMIFIVTAILVHQFEGWAAVFFILMEIFFMLPVFAPMKGFWETTVKGDIITASRCWIFVTRAKISDIDYCKQTRGGTHIYLKGQKDKIMSIDSLSTNQGTFLKRMREEGIEVFPFEIKGSAAQG